MFESYQDYLKSPIWKKIRDVAIIRARGRCQLCNYPETLNVHHRKYPVVWGTEPQSDLTVLCERCHTSFHETIKPKELPQEPAEKHSYQKMSSVERMRFKAWNEIEKQRKTQLIFD